MVMVVTTELMLSAFSRIRASLEEMEAVDSTSWCMVFSMAARAVRPLEAREAA